MNFNKLVTTVNKFSNVDITFKLPGKLQELLPVHVAAVVLVDGSEGGARLVHVPHLGGGLHRRGPRAAPPATPLQVLLHNPGALGKVDKLISGKYAHSLCTLYRVII